MNTLDQLNYVNGLHTLMKEIETNAGINRPTWLITEYERAYLEFRNTVEQENETRKRQQQPRRPEAGADQSSSKPQLRGEHRAGAESEDGPDDARIS